MNKDDGWETPDKLFKWLCARYGFYPILDVCATKNNKKCNDWLGEGRPDYEGNGLVANWMWKNWCNPPHSNTEEWVKKACHEFLENNNETMMIIPANSMCTSYAEACIELHAEYHPIFERPKFLQDGKEKDVSRNSYFVVLWRRK